MKNREDYSGLSLEELKDKLVEVVEEMDNLRIQKATHQLTNPLRIREVRKEIARLKTFIRQHELNINVEESEQA